MNIIDTHCHLNDEVLLPHIEEIISRATSSGISIMQVIGWDEESSKIAIDLSKRFSCLFATVGVHPNNIDEHLNTRLEVIKKLATHSKVVAIGETGLDYYWQKSPENHELQKKYFISQINLANDLHLPIVVHSRDALLDTLNILKEHTPIYGGVMHCYSGSKEMMKEFIALGMYISLAGPVTYANAKNPKEVALSIPLDKLLLETDCPYLTPVPFRGKKNEPSYIKYVLETIASIRGESVEKIADATTQNALRVFHVKHG